MAATFSIESTIQDVMDRRDMSADFLGLLAAMYSISGSSQSRISQALRGARPFTSEHEPLLTLVQDIDDFCRSVEPIPIALKRPAIIKRLLDQHLEKKREEQALIRPCYIIEFDNQELLQRFVDGECRRTRVNADAAAIRDEATAKAVVRLLNDQGLKCRTVSTRRRLTEAQLARSVPDLGITA